MKLRYSTDILLTECDLEHNVLPKYLSSDYNIDIKSKQSFQLLLEAYKEGDKFAPGAIANFYHDEDSIIKHNLEEAIHWYLIAFNESGIIESGFEVARIFWYQKKYCQAFEIYRKIASINDHIALSALGIFYVEGLCVEKDLNKALELFLLSTNQGNLNAPIRAAQIYFKKWKLIKGLSIILSTIPKRFIEGYKYANSDKFRNN